MQTDQTQTDIEAAQQRLHTGRNEPCPCGSGRKYKKCCLARDETLVRQAAETARQMAQPAEPLPPPAAQPIRDSSDEKFDDKGWDEPPSLFDTHTEPVEGVPPEVDQKLEALWNDFEAIEKPSTEQMNTLLDALLSVPPEATVWSEVFSTFAKFQHANLFGVFRRITRSVPHTDATGISFFYWSALDELIRRGYCDLVPEVLAELCTLDLESYDIEALAHIEDLLLANGLDAEMLRLGDHFLPILRQDEDLFPHVAPELAHLIFEIRAGRLLLENREAAPDVESVAHQLRVSIEEEVYPEMASHLAAVALGQAPPPAWTHAELDLPPESSQEEDPPRPESLRLFGALLRVAQEGYQFEQFPPGCAFPALLGLLEVMPEETKSRKKKRIARNLLQCLQPAGMEQRFVRHSRELMGFNRPRLLLLLQAHELLFHCAVRHELISSGDARQTEAELARLRALITAPSKGEEA